jgi:hypothetical protein
MSQQNVYVDESSIQSGAGITEITVVYNATDTEVSGLGLRIHYDSSQLSVNGITNVLSSDLTFAYANPSADGDDFDNDLNTDQFIDLGWASVDGDWPGSSPVSLVTISFDDANLDETSINFTSSSNAVGFDFIGQSVDLSSSADDLPPVFTSPEVVSIDENMGESQVIYTASSNASSSVTYSLVDNTDYPADSTITSDSETAAATQTVSASNISSAQPGEQLSLTVNYSADDTQLTGLGLRIHYDSSLLTVANINEVFSQDLIFVNDDAQSDVADFDSNASTDSFVTVAWASLNGDWPNEELPSELLTVLFDVSADASGSAAVGFSEIETAVGYDFSAPNYDIAINGSPLSINAATGEVSLSDNPDFEAQDSYNFTVTATDTSGQSVDQEVALSVNNLDEVAPVITSADSTTIDEDTGAGQVIYTAIADDSADVSDGVAYSLVDTTDYANPSSTTQQLSDGLQMVSVSGSPVAASGDQVAISVAYNADDNQLPGMGLRIHFDSTMLSVAQITDVIDQEDVVFVDSSAQSDAEDFDADASTDSFVTVAWASLNGDWPDDRAA